MRNVETTGERWVVEKRTELLLAMMNELAGDARISFEGDFQDLRIFNVPGASKEDCSFEKKHHLA